MSRFDGYKAIPISVPPAVTPVPAIIQSTATYATWLFENTTILCTSPNLALANLEAAFESSFENGLEVQVFDGEFVVWLDDSGASPVKDVRH